MQHRETRRRHHKKVRPYHKQIARRVTNFFGRGKGVVGHVKISPSFYLIAVQNLVVVSHTLCADVRGPNKFGGRWGPPVVMGTWLTSRNTPVLHVGCHTKFGPSRSSGTSLCRDIRWKRGSLRPTFQGHLRSSEPTRIYRPPMTVQ